MATTKKRVICWKCKRKIIITKTIQIMTNTYKRFGIEKHDSSYWCGHCLKRLNDYLNSPTGADTLKKINVDGRKPS